MSARFFSGVLVLVLHLLVAVALMTGTETSDWTIFALVYPVQMIGAGIGLHRYFAHRTFRTSRWFQFGLALMAAGIFGDPVGFAGKHRIHHRRADTEDDVHAPAQGLWFCWVGSQLDCGYREEDILAHARDLQRYPELMWLHRNAMAVGLLLALFALAFGGYSAMAIGVLLGPVILFHQSCLVNYLCHRFGSRRFQTGDSSTNNALVGILVFGEGWHNNHHRYPSSARAGFTWWEIDMFYWVICLFEALGLIWDVRRPPAEALEGSRRVFG